MSLEAYSNELAPAPSWMGGFGAVQLLLELPLSSPSCSVPQCPLVDNGGGSVRGLSRGGGCAEPGPGLAWGARSLTGSLPEPPGWPPESGPGATEHAGAAEAELGGPGGGQRPGPRPGAGAGEDE